MIQRILSIFSLLGILLVRSAECAVITAVPSVTTTPLVDRDLEGNVEESIKNITQYFMKYTELEKEVPTPSESSENGQGGTTVIEMDLTRTPSFMERVVQLQEEAGLVPTGIISASLLKVTKKDRCGMTDPPRDPDAPANYRVKWKWDRNFQDSSKQYHLTYSFTKKEFPDNNNVPHRDIEEGVLSAMCMWEMHTNIRFATNVGDNIDSADLKIAFGRGKHGDNYPFDGKGGTLAHAFYPTDGRLHFDMDELWYLSRDDQEIYSKRDIFTVAAHEIGHNLGLDHSTKTALMAPIYNFVKSFKNFQLPHDDIYGMSSMYGNVKSYADPLTENSNACKELKRKFNVVHSSKDNSGPSTTTRKPRRTRSTTTTTTRTTTTRRPTRTKTTTPWKLPTTTTNTCEDDKTLGSYCDEWKRAGFCTSQVHAESMERRCKRTCNFCAVKTDDSVCSISRFDSVTTVYDGYQYFDAYFVKDDYYVRPMVRLDVERDSPYSLLNSHSQIKDVLTFISDPKKIKPGVHKVQRIFKSEKNSIRTMLSTRKWYLLFQRDGTVHQYARSSPSSDVIKTYNIGDLFEDYPHTSVDASYMEYTAQRKSLYTLFHKDKMWQFMEKNEEKLVDRSTALKFEMVQGRSGVSISKWHGVGACNVDAVFKYKGVPYFLKGNLFWPATDAEQAVARDITYHFFRCWDGEAKIYDVPTGCSSGRSSSRTPGGAAASFLSNTFVLGVCSLIASSLLLLPR